MFGIKARRAAEARNRAAGRARRDLDRARYLISCAQRCAALPACRAAYLADARAAIARARSAAA